MQSERILLSQLPDELKELVEIKDAEAIINYFFEYDIDERRLADALSRYAIVKDDVELHRASAGVYMHCLPYLDDAFHLAYFHEWRALELMDFTSRDDLSDFLQNREHPDFDMIPETHYEWVQNKLDEIRG
ncbi:hypothetical protein [Macrococcus bovicus]|uniref:Uncharacterized protein n=1 Tax=Macrococcus bovicus TaxID=69968 RepID=A0A4V3BFJ2_9STAP|nr:hypothetical protein [Macrococcus bovicus]TDM13400.1 hypothetical protein ERX55_09110 [Macrococcus bovicus]WJP98084.1 hypothetical protein QSV55_01880 [Macrococcus bovicus]